MPKEPSSPLNATFARLRSQAGRARRWLAAQGPATRVALLVVGLGTLVMGGYYASLEDPADQTMAWLYDGRKLSSDKLAAIKDALDSAGIPCASDAAQGRIGVKPDRKVEALAAVAKRGVVPHSLDDLNKDADAENPWTDTQEIRDRRELSRHEQKLKIQIEQLDPVVISSADIEIHRAKPTRGTGPGKVGVFVYLQTEGGRKLPDRVVEGIETFLMGAVSDLKPEGITVADHTGRKYLAADNPSLKERLQTHAREEDWRDKILEELRHIPDVGVAVLLEQVQPPAPAPEPTRVVETDVIHPNGKVDLGPERAPVVPGPPPAPITKARVWVRVPKSFYVLAAQAQFGHHPSPEDMQLMSATTRRVIQHAVEAHIPKDLFGGLEVDTVQDDLSNQRTMFPPLIPETRQVWTWPVIGGSAAIVTLILIATMLRLATRKPLARTAPSAWRPGYVADGPSGPVPGPSERVRELIRTSPEAAAGVLQRWIGQEGVTS